MLRPVSAILCIFFAVAGDAAAQAPSPLHDATLDDVRNLQNPRTLFDWFPADLEKRPDWVEILRKGLISPRETVRGEKRAAEHMGTPPSGGILFTNTREMPHVVFPHQPHVEWLACANCHDGLFERKASGRGQGMDAILAGRHCGVCHGRVAFSPEGSCYRCHTVPHPGSLIQQLPAQQTVVVPAADSAPKRIPLLDAGEGADDEGGKKRRRRESGAPASRSALRPAPLPKSE